MCLETRKLLFIDFDYAHHKFFAYNLANSLMKDLLNTISLNRIIKQNYLFVPRIKRFVGYMKYSED